MTASGPHPSAPVHPKMAEAKAKIANAVTPHVLGLAMITDAEKITVRLAKEDEVCWGLYGSV